MTTPIGKKIRERAWSYVLGQSTLKDFEKWFVPIAWEIEKFRDQDAERLAYQISNLLAEYSNGDRTEVSLRTAMIPSLNEISLGVVAPSNSSSGQIVFFPASSDRKVVVGLTQFAEERAIPLLRQGEFQTTTTLICESLDASVTQSQGLLLGPQKQHQTSGVPNYGLAPELQPS